MVHEWVHRRDFLRMGSAAAAGIAATRLSAGTLNKVTRIEGVDPILSVGFADVTTSDSARLIAAGRLPSGDSRFGSNAARVTVHGLWETDASRSAASAVYVSAFFHDAGAAVPFMAWSSVSPRLHFTMDLAGRDRLSLGIERERIVRARALDSRMAKLLGFRRDGAEELPRLDALEQSGGLCELQLGRGAGMKLRAGTYVVALRRTPWDRTPDWRSIRVDAKELRAGGESVLRVGDAPVAFDYLVFSVSHA